MISGGGITKTIPIAQAGIPVRYIFQLQNFGTRNQIFVSLGANMESSYLELTNGTIAEFTDSGTLGLIEAECPAEEDCSVYFKANTESNLPIEIVATNAPFGINTYNVDNIQEFVSAMPEALPNSGSASLTMGHTYDSQVTSNLVWDQVGTEWSRLIIHIYQNCKNISKRLEFYTMTLYYYNRQKLDLWGRYL